MSFPGEDEEFLDTYAKEHAFPSRSFKRSEHTRPGNETCLGGLVIFWRYNPGSQRLIQSLQCFIVLYFPGRVPKWAINRTQKKAD